MHSSDYGWTDEAPESSSYINQAVINLATRLGARRILDAGCGNGTLCADLEKSGFHVVGTDADERGIALARKRCSSAQFFVQSFCDCPPGLFDLVVSSEVVEHLYSPMDLAKYAFDALRPGGAFIITTPYHGYLKNLAIAVFNKWDSHHTANWHGGHIKFWSKSTLSKLLDGAGFDNVVFHGVGRVRWLWKSMILTARKPANFVQDGRLTNDAPSNYVL